LKDFSLCYPSSVLRFSRHKDRLELCDGKCSLTDENLFEACNKLQLHYKIIMINIRFEWNNNKDKTNFKNHGVSFAEAKTVFYDENALEFYDQDHSLGEDRYLMIGLSSKLRLLLVNYTVREERDEDVIRIISSRKPTKREQTIYFERLK